MKRLACTAVMLAMAACGGGSNPAADVAADKETAVQDVPADTADVPDAGPDQPEQDQLPDKGPDAGTETKPETTVDTAEAVTEVQVDVPPECVPVCEGKECGDDGCGGVCGECMEGELCGEDGLCACQFEACGEGCCAEGEVCTPEGTCCKPNCEMLFCGDDGCGGVCGHCKNFCKDPPEIDDTLCKDHFCTTPCCPDCTGKQCGPDKCGGICGECLNPCPTPEHPDVPWVDPSLCQGNGKCKKTCCPSCEGKVCGDDGCGASCGACPFGEVCVEFMCLSDPCISEGKSSTQFPAGFECCAGLGQIPAFVPDYNVDCDPPQEECCFTCDYEVPGAFVCTHCGDKVCGPGENECNCADCPCYQDEDPDVDGVKSAEDNCPLAYNPDQKDSDLDGDGDACDYDDDGDLVLDAADNCPTVYNPDQKDTDMDGTGDACEGACGDPAPYAKCTWDLTEADCIKYGGQWGKWGLSPIPSCMCPTGDGGCPCKSKKECVGACLAPLGANNCAGLTAGTCAPTKTTFGCYCFFEEAGQPAVGICID